LPGKFPEFPQTNKVYSKEIKYSDIDLNKHVNNAKYLELLSDCYDESFHRENKIKTLIVSFISESKYGDLLEVYKNSNSKNEKAHIIEAKNLSTEKSVFNAMVEWQRIL
jgi:acyl-ACP thioesterase